MILKLCDRESLRVKVLSHIYSVRSMHTDISLDMCDVKRSRTDGVFEVRRVGRCSQLLKLRSCDMKEFDFFMNCILLIAFLDS